VLYGAPWARSRDGAACARRLGPASASAPGSRAQAPRASEAAKRLALLAVGEIGRSADLSRYGALRGALTDALASGSEEVKAAAAVALGGVALGNLPAYLPFIMAQISAQARPRRPCRPACGVRRARIAARSRAAPADAQLPSRRGPLLGEARAQRRRAGRARRRAARRTSTCCSRR